MWTRCLGGFSVMWVTKLLISPVKIRIFCPKKSKFGPKMAFLFFLGQALPAHLVGGCGARAVSCKTPIYFIYIDGNWKHDCTHVIKNAKQFLGGVAKRIKYCLANFWSLFYLPILPIPRVNSTRSDESVGYTFFLTPPGQQRGSMNAKSNSHPSIFLGP